MYENHTHTKKLLNIREIITAVKRIFPLPERDQFQVNSWAGILSVAYGFIKKNCGWW